jgi:hypothetical protein
MRARWKHRIQSGIAAISLVCRLAALGSCGLECSGGQWHHDHQRAAAPVDSDDDHGHDSQAPHEEGGFCSSLHATDLAPGNPPFVQPRQEWGQVSSALILSPGLSETSNQCLLPRQAKSRFWVFTPEVCLGPAIRGRAPPLG